MELLINKNTVEQYLQVAIGVTEDQFNIYILEAQDFNLKTLLCEEFFYDLITKKEEEVWKKLIDGGSYVYNGRNYMFPGIAKVLSYFTYARFILKSNVVSTSHGFVTKKSTHSEPLSIEERRNFYHSYRKDANTVFEDVKKFIERNVNDYPSWNCNSDCSKTEKASFKSRVIQ
jgi:hypothetical protein